MSDPTWDAGSVPMVRSLRRRLWHALKEDDAATALRAYQCTKRDWEKWLEEEAAEEALQMQLAEEARLREKQEKREARPAALKKLGNLVSSMTNGANNNTTNNNNKRGSHSGNSSSLRRRGATTRKLAPTADPTAELPKGSWSNSNSNSNSNNITGNGHLDNNEVVMMTTASADTSVSILQLHMNPSEPFLPDDHKSPHGDYDEPQVPTSSSSATTASNSSRTVPNRLRRKRSTGPRLAGFLGRSGRSDAGSEDDSVEGNSNNNSSNKGVDVTLTTPLHEACRVASLELVRLMLANGGDPNFRNGTQRTSLHMAAGGVTAVEETVLLASKAGTRRDSNGGKLESAAITVDHGLGIGSPLWKLNDDANDDNASHHSGRGATRAAKAMGRFLLEKIGSRNSSSSSSTQERHTPLTRESKPSAKIDPAFLDQLKQDRLDTCTLLLKWTHPQDRSQAAGEGVSINSVDYRGRTALHYAAEVGRSDVCMELLATFGAMLTIVDDNSRTPCELAAERSHKLLASQLEARALLYSDPSGLDDEAVLSSFLSSGRPNEDDLNGSSAALVPPFSWFDTLTLKQVQEERQQRVAELFYAMKRALTEHKEREDAKELMYSHMGDDLSSDDQKLSSKFDQVVGESANQSLNEIDNFKSLHMKCLPGIHQAESESLATAKPERPFEAKTKSSSTISGTVPHLQQQDGDDDSAVAPSNNLLPDEDMKKPACHSFHWVDFFQESHAELFLAHHSWKINEALEATKDDPIQALEEANIKIQVKPATSPRQGNVTCLICFDEFTVDSADWCNLTNCEHGFCVSCLGAYLRDCASMKSGLTISCPHHGCSAYLSREEIEKLAPDEDVFSSLQASANENFVAAANDLRFCPHPGCNCVVKRLVLPFMLSKGILDEEILDYSGAVCKVIDDNVATTAETPLTYEGVADPNFYQLPTKLCMPRKAHRFCFACNEEEVHWPAPCETLEAWKQKVAEEKSAVQDGDEGSDEKFDDVAQKLWMKANTRPCPKCKAPIEKNDGCNHMSCSNPHCKHEFCWICRKDWKLHNTDTGGFFRCNRWQGEDDHEFYDTPPPVEDRTPQPASLELLNIDEDQVRYGTAVHSARVAWKKSKEMSRFLHYFRRWNAHSESLFLERKMHASVCTRMAPVVDAARAYMEDPNFNFDGKGLSFVFSAFAELLECRSFLQHSYAFAYYRYPLNGIRSRFAISRGREKGTFEQRQSELEMMTEQLSDIVARSHLRATMQQIVYLTRVTAEKRKEFYRLLITILKDQRKEDLKKSAEGDDRASIVASSDFVGVGGPSTTGMSWFGEDAFRIRAPPLYGYDDVTPAQRALRATLREFLNHRDEVDEALYRDVDDFDDSSRSSAFRWANWSCSVCTYMNSGVTRCAMCGAVRTR